MDLKPTRCKSMKKKKQQQKYTYFGQQTLLLVLNQKQYIRTSTQADVNDS